MIFLSILISYCFANSQHPLSNHYVGCRYGPAPTFYVELQLLIDPKSNIYNAGTYNSYNSVVIETARVEYMPHSVFHFLELVSHNVYDGTTFHRRANHIIQAGPSVKSLDYNNSSLQLDPSLGSVMFQEYSSEVPHKMYTLGFAGRPGGPDFYINMKDNSKLHGPGGQTWHYGDIVDDADPCFGTVLKGVDVIDMIYQSAVMSPGYNDTIVHPVLIKKMTILDANGNTQAGSPLRGRGER